MFHSVIIATKGRAKVLVDTLACLFAQSQIPDEVIVSASSSEDIAGLPRKPGCGHGNLKIICGNTGLPHQRNSAIEALDDRSELITFLDDDVELSRSYVRNLVQFARKSPWAFGISGTVVLDGASREQARHRLAAAKENAVGAPVPCTSLYGCNMTYTRDALARERFDQRMSLYAWLEDLDFSRRIARHGALVTLPNLPLVHLRSPLGRMHDKRFGFAQVMNPWYLWKKGVLSGQELWNDHLLKGIGSNLAHLPLNPAARLRRIQGNLGALAMISANRVEPEAVFQI